MSLTPITIPTSGAVVLSPVPFSPTPVFAFPPGIPRLAILILTGNVVSSSIDTTSLSAGADICLMIQQDPVGGRTFAWPPNVYGAQPIAAGANQTTVQAFRWTGQKFLAQGLPSIF